MTLRKILQFIYRAEIPNIVLNGSVMSVAVWLFITGVSLSLDVVKFSSLPVMFLMFSIFYIAHYWFKTKNNFHASINQITVYSVLAIMLAMFNYFPKTSFLFTHAKWGELIAAVVALSSLWVIYAMVQSLKVVNEIHSSDVKNPSANRHNFYAKMAGFIFTSFCLVLLYKFQLQQIVTYMSIVSALVVLVSSLVIAGQYTPMSVQPKLADKIESQFEQTTEFSKDNLPFLYLFFGIVFISMTVLCTHMWTALIGLYEFKESKSIPTSQMLSNVMLVHGIIYGFTYLVSLNSNYSVQKKWFSGFKLLFVASTLSSAMIFFATKSSWMIVSSFVIFSIAYPLLQQNQVVLWEKIPSFIRSKIEEISHVYLFAACAFGIGSIVWISLNTSLSIKSLWLIMSICSIVGIAVMNELHRVFADYHVGNILRGDVYQAVECCEFLANPQSQGHYMALISILKQNPRPILAKSILKTLGAMKSPEVVDDLIEFYHQAQRDDIRVETVRALSNYESHHLNLFLLETLESIVQDDAFKTEEKRELFHVIALKLDAIAIPTILKILKDNADNFRIIANSILVLGELAVQTQDESLFYLLSKYLAPIYSRRIRANASLYLYMNQDYKKYANACISSLLTSGNEYDRNAVAYIAGELKLESLTPFVLEASSKIQHQSSTLIIALLKLGYPNAKSILAERIINSERNIVLDLMKMINMIKDDQSRYSVYFHIFSKYPSKVDYLLEMMSLSEKNFDRDRMLLFKHALRLGLSINRDRKLFLEKGLLRAVA